MTPVTLGAINNTWLSNATWSANNTEKNSRNDTSDSLHIKITPWLDTNAKNAITTESNFRNMTSATLNTNSNTSLGNASWVANSTESYFGNITSPEINFAVSVTMYTLFVISVCLVILGLLGNMTTILIMQKRPFKSTTHSILLSALAITDTLGLPIFLLFKPCVAYLFGFDMRSLGDVVCRLLQYLSYIARVGGSAMIILICLERFIAVCFPFKAKFILAKKSAYIAVCVCSLLAILVGGLVVRFSGVEDVYCAPISANTPVATLSLPAIIAPTIFLPALVILCHMPFTVGKLCRSRGKLSTKVNQPEDKTARTATMLISTVIWYFILMVVASIIIGVLEGAAISQFSLLAPWIKVVLEFHMTLDQVNVSLNFFLYSMVSSDFRRAFQGLFSTTLEI